MIFFCDSVTYWPSAEPSIQKQVHPIEDVEDVTLTCGRVEFGAHATPTGSRWTSDNYTTRWVSWSQLFGVSWLEFEAVKTSSRQRACSPQWPPVEQLRRMRKKYCYSQRNLGSICCSLFRLQLTSHTQPFREVWEVYFSKEVCSFVILVENISGYICIRIVVSRLYNNNVFDFFLFFLMWTRFIIFSSGPCLSQFSSWARDATSATFIILFFLIFLIKNFFFTFFIFFLFLFLLLFILFFYLFLLSIHTFLFIYFIFYSIFLTFFTFLSFFLPSFYLFWPFLPFKNLFSFFKNCLKYIFVYFNFIFIFITFLSIYVFNYIFILTFSFIDTFSNFIFILSCFLNLFKPFYFSFFFTFLFFLF